MGIIKLVPPATIFGYFIVGGFGRLIPFPGYFGSVNIYDLYIIIFGVVLFINRRFSFPCKISLSLLAIIFVWATLFYLIKGDSIGLLYNLRLILLLFSGVLIGNYFRDIRYTISSLSISIINVFLISSLLSLVLLIIFPDLRELSQILQSGGINLKVDPHVNRLYSNIFDPNLFAILTALPASLSLVLVITRKKMKYFCIFCFYLLILFLSQSRSGFICYLFSVAGLLWFYRRTFISWKIIAFLTLSSFLILIFDFTIIERLQNTSLKDGSTNLRLYNFLITLDLFIANLFFGSGYGYIIKDITDLGLHGIDSGILLIFSSFGIIGSSIIIFLLSKIFSKTSKISKQHASSQTELGLHVAWKNYFLINYFIISFVNQIILFNAFILMFSIWIGFNKHKTREWS